MRASEFIITEDLRKWFKEKWVRFGPDGKIRGSCARGSKKEGKPKCLPQSKAHALGKKGRASAAARKRRQDPNPERKGKAKNVRTKKVNEDTSKNQSNQSVIFLNSNTVIVGQIHGKPPNLSGKTLKKVQDIAAKHGAWYEGDGSDQKYTKDIIDKYVGSFDDEIAKNASPKDPKWIYVLFSNVDVNNRIERVGIDPKDTIFNRLLTNDKDNSYQGIGFTPRALQKFLRLVSQDEYDFVKMSRKPATKKNLTHFLKTGEALMWPDNWEEYPNRAGKIAKLATVNTRDKYLASRKFGAYFVGGSHLHSIKEILQKQKKTNRGGKAKIVATKKKIKEAFYKANDKIIGLYKVTGYYPSINTVSLENYRNIELDKSIRDKPRVGYAYAFQIKDNKAVKIISLTADNVIIADEEILLIKRKSNPYAEYWTLPGGFVEPGETTEQAARRELAEETGLKTNADMKFIGKFDKPNRDPRMRNVWSFAYLARVPKESVVARDDASEARWVSIGELKNLRLAFDHKTIIEKSGILNFTTKRKTKE